MTEGKNIIKELGRRGLRGYYFSYSQYRELVKIKEFEKAKSRIITWGFDVNNSKNTTQIVDSLKKSTQLTTKEKKWFGVVVADFFFWLLLGLGSC